MNKLYVKENGKTFLGEEAEEIENIKNLQLSSLPLTSFTGEITGATKYDVSVRTVRTYLDSLSRSRKKEYIDFIELLTYKVITSKSIEDLVSKEYINSFFSTLYSKVSVFYNAHNDQSVHTYDSRKNIDNRLTNDLDAIITIAKDVIRRYVKLSLAKFSTKNIEEMYDSITKGCNPLLYLNMNSFEFISIEDEVLRDLISKLFQYYIYEKTGKLGVHLCMDCSVSILDCPKMLDQIKKNISDYDFIVDGTQKTHDEKMIDPYDEKRRLIDVEITDELMVTNCKKYFRRVSSNTKKRYKLSE